MRITHIFAALKESETLSAVRYDEETYDKPHHTELDRLFACWTNYEYLEDIFSRHKESLQSGFFGVITVEDAVQETIEETRKLFRQLLAAAKKADGGDYQELYDMFSPLHKTQNQYPVLTLKAYGPEYKSWLRLYALSLDNDILVIVGGTIKLHENINTHPHNIYEKEKVSCATNFFHNRLAIKDGYHDSDGFYDLDKLT